MYNEYFGFKESPFSIAPDPRYLYMTAQHREALAHLVYGLNSEGGCILLTGEVGTGKTTICRCLLEQIPDQANVALLLNPKVSELELLETICDELHISYPDSNNSAKAYTDRIYDFLIESNRKNEKTVLIIDEGQNLDSKVLEQLRLLTNLETDQRKLLQIIILGQPELLDVLAKTEMRQLAQRITARFHLQPLTRSEVKAYVSHRLAIAGQHIQLFPENSIKLLYKLSNGIPRLINIICDRALLGAYVENQYVVNTPIIKKAATEVFGELKNVEKNQKNQKWLLPVTAFSIITVIAIATLLYLAKSPENTTDTSLLASIAVTPNEQQPLSTENDKHQPVNELAMEKVSVTRNKTEEDAIQTSATDSIESLHAPEKAHNEKTGFINTKSEIGNAAGLDYDNIDQMLNNTDNNPASAYKRLFKAWNKNYNEKSAITACNQAEKISLSCLHKQGNLNNLKVHNRPAVLTLVNKQGETRYVTITSIHDEAATVLANNKTYTVKLSDLDKFWYGQFVILWKKPAHYSSVITPGDSGYMINWLNTQLSKITNTHSSNIVISTYDDNLVNKVKAFQRQQGLTADGIVGPVTIIHINTRSGMGIPSLMPAITKQG